MNLIHLDGHLFREIEGHYERRIQRNPETWEPFDRNPRTLSGESIANLGRRGEYCPICEGEFPFESYEAEFIHDMGQCSYCESVDLMKRLVA